VAGRPAFGSHGKRTMVDSERITLDISRNLRWAGFTVRQLRRARAGRCSSHHRIACASSCRIRHPIIGIKRPAHVYDSEQHGEDDHARQCELYQSATRLSVFLSDASHHYHSSVGHIAIAYSSRNLPGVIGLRKNRITLDLLISHPYDCFPVGLVRRGQSRVVKQRTEVCVGRSLDALNNLTIAASYCRTGAGKKGLITGRPR